jgi:hypothetical protein
MEHPLLNKTSNATSNGTATTNTSSMLRPLQIKQPMQPQIKPNNTTISSNKTSNLTS